MAKDDTDQTLTRSKSNENSLDLPAGMPPSITHSTATQGQIVNESGGGAYFDVLLPAQGGPATKSQISAVVTETTGQYPVPNATGNGNYVYFDVLLPKQGSAVQEHMPVTASHEPTSPSMSGDTSTDNEALFSDGDSRCNSVVISERALSVSSISSSNSAHASPVYENVTLYNEREKSRSVSPNHSSPRSSAEVREEWVLPRQKWKSLQPKRASFDELALQGAGEESRLAHHAHVAGQRVTKSLEGSSLQWEQEASKRKCTVGYVNLENIDMAVSHVTSEMGKVYVHASEAGRGTQRKMAATEYINITVGEKPPKQRPSSSAGYHREEYVNVELPSRPTGQRGRQSVGMGSEYVNLNDSHVLKSVMEVRGGSKAHREDNFVLMDFSGGGRRSEEQAERPTAKRNKFSHVRSQSLDNLMDLAEDTSQMRTTRSRSNALTEKCSPSFRRWKHFGSRDNLLESPLEKTPPANPTHGTKGLNYVTIQHIGNPRKATTQSEDGLVLPKKAASVKITGSSSKMTADVVYMQIDPVATRAIVQTIAQRNSEIATKMKMYSGKATTLS